MLPGLGEDGLGDAGVGAAKEEPERAREAKTRPVAEGIRIMIIC